ncbi:MAG: hypothetical protein Q7K03_00795 [Dehalococcoidia bacterium]|nr:hypothetical protein [Dehalococcoidia bacterium]
MTKQFINPDALSKPTGYTHVVKAGNLVFIAGQAGAGGNGNVAVGVVLAQALPALVMPELLSGINQPFAQGVLDQLSPAMET